MLIAGFCLALSLLSCGGAQNRLEPGEQVSGQVVRIDGQSLQLDLGTLQDGAFTSKNDLVMVDLGKATVRSDAGENLTPQDIAVDDVVVLTAGDDGASTIVVSRSAEAVAAEQGSAATELTEAGTHVGSRFVSKEEDESALSVRARDVTLVDCDVSQTGDATDPTKARLFGLDAALLVSHGASAVVDGGTVTSGAEGAAGVFAYGEKTEVTLNKTAVTTVKGSSPAVVATAKGQVKANGAQLTTSGSASPALRVSAQGQASLAGGELVANGSDSPAIESSSNLSAEGTKLTASHSESLVLTGSAQASFNRCSVASAMDANRGEHASVNVQSILICGEGEAAGNASKLSISGGSLTNNAGDLIFVTNASAEIELTGVNVQNADAEAALIRVAENDGSLGWGEAGANAGTATLTCASQKLAGDLVCDRTSKLTVHLTEGSRLEGAAYGDAGEGDPGSLAVIVDSGCTWRLTADSRVSSLENHGTIDFNGFKLILPDGSVLGG